MADLKKLLAGAWFEATCEFPFQHNSLEADAHSKLPVFHFCAFVKMEWACVWCVQPMRVSMVRKLALGQRKQHSSLCQKLCFHCKIYPFWASFVHIEQDFNLLPARSRRRQHLEQHIELLDALLQHMTLAARLGTQLLSSGIYGICLCINYMSLDIDIHFTLYCIIYILLN